MFFGDIFFCLRGLRFGENYDLAELIFKFGSLNLFITEPHFVTVKFEISWPVEPLNQR